MYTDILPSWVLCGDCNRRSRSGTPFAPGIIDPAVLKPDMCPSDREQKGRGGTASERRRAVEKLKKRAAGCQNCDLWRNATQTVFGDGPATAELMLVGEQPGDQEDRSGQPFVGAAGRVLSQALEQAGLETARV